MLLLTVRFFFASAYAKNNNFQCSYDNTSKNEKSWLRFVVIDVHSIWKAVWVKTTEFWVHATTYKGLSCYFMKQRYLASQKTLIQSVPFLIPQSFPLLYVLFEGKNTDNGGVLVRGEGRARGEQGESQKDRWAWLKGTLFWCD